MFYRIIMYTSVHVHSSAHLRIHASCRVVALVHIRVSFRAGIRPPLGVRLPQTNAIRCPPKKFFNIQVLLLTIFLHEGLHIWFQSVWGGQNIYQLHVHIVPSTHSLHVASISICSGGWVGSLCTADFTCVRIFRASYGISFCVGPPIPYKCWSFTRTIHWYGRSYAKGNSVRSTEKFERKWNPL